MTNSLTEQQQAEILEEYLAGLEQGDGFNIPKNLDDPETVSLMKLGKHLRVHNSSSVPSESLLNSFPKQKRSPLWKLLIPLPLMGAALLGILMITLQQPATTVHLSSADVNDVETKLAEVEQLDQDLQVTINDLDATLTEVDQILADDSFADIEATINDSAL